MIQFHNVSKIFQGNSIIKNISFTTHHGEFICITGHVGFGKSTILKLLTKEYSSDSGEIYIEKIPLSSLKGQSLQVYRRKLGMIFQDFRLFPQKTVFETISEILEICGEKSAYIFPRVKKVLTLVHLEEKIGEKISNLSQGEVQRVVLARAIIHNPKILIADEIASNLDDIHTKEILTMLKTINEQMKITIIFATHNPSILSFLRVRTLVLDKGTLIKDEK